MRTTDKFLIGIIAGIALLVIVAFAVTLTRPKPAYQDQDTPEGVAHDYLLALQKREYQRALGYLSSGLQGYPASEDEFIETVERYSWQFRSDAEVTLAVESTTVTGDRALVKVRESRFRGGNLFDSQASTSLFEMRLQREDDGWKVVDSEYYFAWCWRHADDCR